MKKEDCKNSSEWDYLGYKIYPEIDDEYATDWYITLMTKINMIRNMVLSNSRQYGPNKIKLHPNLKPLIDILVGTYGTILLDQYSIVFDYGIDEDIIFVYYDGSIRTIPLINGDILELKFITQCSEEEILEYKKTTCGYIKILNYTNMEKEPTLGQRRVKADFNPAKNDLVDQIKNKSAELIDLLETMRNLPLTGTGEKQRLVSLAQTAFEEGAMWAVKANFTE
jgi:hypothetical protein